jgi:hypothetical protein
MLHKRRGWWTLAILFGAGLPMLFAQPPREEPQVVRAEPDKKTAPEAKKLDLLKLPPEAVIILADAVKDPTKLTPQSVHMTPEKYQEYLDIEARLKKLLQADKLATPSKCQLKGKMDGTVVLLEALFEFETRDPNSNVWLACAPAQPTEAQLDGHTPLLKSEASGCSMQIEKPGEHKLTLNLTLKLTTKGGDTGFELELPRAAITMLDLTLPENVKDVRVGGKPWTDDRNLTLKNSELAGGLGPVDKLDVKWRKPGAGGNTPPVLSSTAHIAVQFDDRETLINTELTLKSEGNPTAVWPLVVPLGATVKLAKEDEPKLQNIGTANQPFAALRTVRLKEPVNELKVNVTVHGPAPRAGTVVPVGPFLLQNAQRQTGTIAVTNNLQDVYLHFVPHGDVERDDGVGDTPTGIGFRYNTVRLPEKPSAVSGPSSMSLLDVEPQSTRGLVVTTVQHALRLEYDDKRGGYVWRVRTTIDATPFRTGVDHLDVQLPPQCVLNKDFARKPDASEVDPTAQPLRFTKLASDPLKPFKLTFEAEYEQPVAESGKTTLVLPRPLDTRDGGGGVTVSVQGNHLELLPPEQPSSLEPGVAEQQPQQQVWVSKHMPERIDVAWQPYKPKVRASSIVDLTLTAHEGRVEGRVQQTFRFHFPHAAPAQVTLHFPEAIADRWKLVRGGEAGPGPDKGPSRVINLAAPDKDQARVLVLEYTFPLFGDKETITIPLVTPEQITGGDSKVRVWSEVGAVPGLGGDAWLPGDIEAVANQPTLPVLVAHAPRLDAPLSLRFSDGASSVAVLTERVLVRVEVGGDGVQTYRVRYLLTPLGADHLDIEFPAPVPSLNLRVLHDGVAVTPEAVDENGKPTDGSRIARLRLSSRLLRKPTVLDVSYQLQALRTGSGLLNTSLQPPVLRGDAGRPTTRWQVTLADGPNLLVLAPDGGPGAEPSWTRRGWLVGPTPDVSAADLDRWFASGQDVPRGDDNEVSPLVTASCWRQGVEPLTVVHMPRKAWLLTCSLSFLGVSLFLFLLARRSNGSQTTLAGWFYGFLALLPVAVIAGLFFQPTLAAALVYGCAPALLVLLGAVAVHLIMQERQRRQIVFLPSFRRGGSSILRAQSSAARHGEPSTVDVPRPGSSQWPTGEVHPSESNSGNKAK